MGDIEHAGLLDADEIPNANQSLSCFSCGESMNGVFCYACGNKNDNYRRSIWSLGVELFSSLTAFEGRIWRSLRSLLIKPGQMAREYSDGARQKWTSPIRMYLATSLLLFGYVALSGTQLIAFGAKLQASSVIQMGVKGQNLSPQVFFLERKSTISKMISEDAIAAFEEDMVNLVTDDDDKSKEEPENELEKAEDDNDTNIELTDMSGNSFTLDSDGFRNAISIGLRHPERINAPIGKYLSRIMFAMMPFSMLLGAIFIRGREKAMLFDHLVHAAYIHAFSFLLLFIFMLLVQFTPIKGLLWIYMAILLIYLPISAKRMFGRSWFKSIITSYGVGVIYTFLMMLILSYLIGMGISDIVKDVAVTNPPS